MSTQLRIIAALLLLILAGGMLVCFSEKDSTEASRLRSEAILVEAQAKQTEAEAGLVRANNEVSQHLIDLISMAMVLCFMLICCLFFGAFMLVNRHMAFKESLLLSGNAEMPEIEGAYMYRRLPLQRKEIECAE